jgi:hypothetical protein
MFPRMKGRLGEIEEIGLKSVQIRIPKFVLGKSSQETAKGVRILATRIVT